MLMDSLRLSRKLDIQRATVAVTNGVLTRLLTADANRIAVIISAALAQDATTLIGTSSNAAINPAFELTYAKPFAILRAVDFGSLLWGELYAFHSGAAPVNHYTVVSRLLTDWNATEFSL